MTSYNDEVDTVCVSNLGVLPRLTSHLLLWNNQQHATDSLWVYLNYIWLRPYLYAAFATIIDSTIEPFPGLLKLYIGRAADID